jgi:NitT/TauT family transport system permease protein
MLTAQLLLQLFEDTSASWLRMLVALAISMVLSLLLGIYMARNRTVEMILLPVLDIFQTLPILTFFPFAIYLFVFLLPGYIGINGAVVFLIITSMLWNMIFGVYEAIKTLPNEISEIGRLYRLGRWKRFTKIYLPAAMPKLVEQSMLSWSIGLFYLVTSEIFSTGNQNYAVAHGIGVAITALAFSGDTYSYVAALAMFVGFVIATRYLLFVPMEKRVTRHYDKAYKHIKMQSRHFYRFRLFRALAFVHMKRRRSIFPERKKHRQPSNETLPQADIGKAYQMHSIRITLISVLFLMILFVLYAHFFEPVLFSYEFEALASLAYSFARVWISFIAILVVAVPLSVYLVFMSRHREAFVSTFQILASIPATIVLPIIALAFRNTAMGSEIVAFLIFFLSGIWYVIFGILSDAKTIDENIPDVKRIFGVKGFRAWKSIYIMAVLPGLVTGAVTAIAAEWNASIVAEYFTSTGISGGSVVTSVGTGMGKLLDIALGNGNLTLMVLALLNLTLMIILINTFVWKRLYRKMSETYR